MGVELKRLGENLVMRGNTAGGMILISLAPVLVEQRLIPPQMDPTGPKARGRKFGPSTFDVDPERVRTLRLERDLSQRSLANNSVLSTSLVSGVERGKYSTISGESARRLARGLGVDLQLLRKVEPALG